MYDRLRHVLFTALRTEGWAEHDIEFCQYQTRQGVMWYSYSFNERMLANPDLTRCVRSFLRENGLRRSRLKEKIVLVMQDDPPLKLTRLHTIATTQLRELVESSLNAPCAFCEENAFVVRELKKPGVLETYKKYLSVIKEETIVMKMVEHVPAVSVSFARC